MLRWSVDGERKVLPGLTKEAGLVTGTAAYCTATVQYSLTVNSGYSVLVSKSLVVGTLWKTPLLGLTGGSRIRGGCDLVCGWREFST